MRIHFIFPTATPEWPVIRLLKERLPEATFDCGGISGLGAYRHRIQLFAKAPWLAYNAFKRLTERTTQVNLPDYVCVQTDIEVIGCLLSRLYTRKNIPIILIGFIYTPRRSRILGSFRWLYFRTLLSRTAGVLCYSRFEENHLPKLFKLAGTPFASVLYGAKVNAPKEPIVNQISKSSYLVSAGRSGRDYQLLCNAVRDLPLELHIVCDSSQALKGLVCPPNVKVLRNCHGNQYIAELAGAALVVLALENNNLSSGQMVLVDAMALGKATIITRTATTAEYGEHLKTCYFVEPGSVEAIRSAIRACLDSETMRSIGLQAQKQYFERHTVEQSVSSLVEKITELTRLHAASSLE